MKVKYPNQWSEKNGKDCYDENGEMTAIARGWGVELKHLTSDQIRVGLRDLSYRENAQYPPSAIEFVRHARNMGAQECADEILDYISQPTETEWWWKSQVAFNVFKALRYNKHSKETTADLTKRAIKIYQKLDMDNLDDLPAKPIALPVKQHAKVDRDRGKFQSKMFFAIMRARPDLLGIEQDKNAVDLFTPHKSNELMYAWYKQDQPDMCQFLRANGIAV